MDPTRIILQAMKIKTLENVAISGYHGITFIKFHSAGTISVRYPSTVIIPSTRNVLNVA
jgi:hypothetical protein